RLGALVADRTSCTRPAQTTEHSFAKAGRLPQRPADRKKCRLSQVEEGPPGIVPRLPNSVSGRASGRELDLPGPPDLGGSDRGRANSGHGALKGCLIRATRFHAQRTKRLGLTALCETDRVIVDIPRGERVGTGEGPVGVGQPQLT